MTTGKQAVYEIPATYRRMENMHIVFWLFKDVAWCMGWKFVGIAMIIPTLAIAILISWRTRQILSELAHNLAVTFWITANAYWMISEFFSFDETIIWNGIEGKYLALLPFTIGILILLYYYMFRKPKESDLQQTSTM